MPKDQMTDLRARIDAMTYAGEAETLARAALDRGTTIRVAAWIVAGEATVQQGRFEEAVECFLNVVKVGGRVDEMAIAHSLAGDVLVQCLTTFGLGGLLGGLVMTAWQRRAARAGDAH